MQTVTGVPSLAPVLDHVNMLLQYTTSSACSLRFEKFTSLIGPRPNPVPTHPPPLVLMPRDHWPVDETLDPWIQVARSESLRTVESYLGQHLSQTQLTGKALRPHEANLSQLTENIAESCLDTGLFASAILVLDSFFPVREIQLKAALCRSLSRRRPTWNQRSVQRQVSLASIQSLDQIHRLSPHVTTLILDMAHLYGSVDHYAWVKYVRTQAKDRSITIVATGWQQVPPIHPGWSLNTEPTTHDAVEDMLLDGPWKRNSTWSPCFRTKVQLVSLGRQLLLQKRGLVVLVRGTSESMEARSHAKVTRSFGRLARTVGLNDLPLYLLTEKSLRPAVQPLLVLQEHIGTKLGLEQWMLLLSHLGDAILVLLRTNDAMDTGGTALDLILSWTREKNLGRLSLTRPIYKVSPWE